MQMAPASGGVQANNPSWASSHSTTVARFRRTMPRVRSKIRGRTSGESATTARASDREAGAMVV